MKYAVALALTFVGAAMIGYSVPWSVTEPAYFVVACAGLVTLLLAVDVAVREQS